VSVNNLGKEEWEALLNGLRASVYKVKGILELGTGDGCTL
jgi:hypothetical protein